MKTINQKPIAIITLDNKYQIDTLAFKNKTKIFAMTTITEYNALGTRRQ